MIFNSSKWIWNANTGEVNSFADFQIKFNATLNNEYVLYLSSCVNHMITLNGEYIPSTQREGFEVAPEYQIVNLSDKVIDGENEIIITVYSQGINSYVWRKRTPGLIYTLCENGKAINVSNENTPSRYNNKFVHGEMEKISSMLGFTFHADLRNDNFEFDNSTIVVDKVRNLKERDIKPLEVSDNIPAELIAQGEFIDKMPDDVPLGQRAYKAFLSSRIITEIAHDTHVGLYNNVFMLDGKRDYILEAKSDCDGVFATVDLKRNTVGYPSFEIEVEEDSRMIVSYGEHIHDMRPRSYPAGYQFAYEVYLKKGKNKFIFPFRRTACQYFMALIYTKKATLSYIGMRECLYPISNLSSFKCSDSIHTKIFETSQRTLRLCMHDHYEDCPSREQAMYIMDSQIQVLCGFYALGEYQFPKSCIEMLMHSFREDNYFEMITPGVSRHTIPSFSINFVPIVWEYYLFSGDKETLAKALPYMTKVVNEQLAHMNDKIGLLPSPQGKGFWNFTEWQKGNDGVVGENDDTNLTYELFNMSYNAFYSIACDSYAKANRELGNIEDAERFEGIRTELNKSIHKYFWDDEISAYKSVLSYEKELPIYYTELANALAVYAGICPEELIEAALEKLASGDLLKITTSHARYKYDALMKRPEKYSQYIMDEISDIWGSMLYKGATSFWETETGPKDFSLTGSMCHGWSTIPVYIYFRYGIGVYPEKPGFAEYSVKPLIKNYKFSCEFKTISETIKM